jgi:formylmethanofuran dehydrogenase subunit E
VSTRFEADFEAVLAFHGHLCLDIAMGYRVAKEALIQLAARGIDTDSKSLVATVEGDTCAVDAVQALTGCTFGKRNLVPKLTGKPAYIWQHAASGEGVRIYVHYWDRFDTDGNFRTTMRQAKSGQLSDADTANFETRHDALIQHILSAPTTELFRVIPVDAPPPPKSGGFTSSPCPGCGEYVKDGLLTDGLCNDCSATTYR